eukprot:scpid34651/ scgid4459/ Proprotein convertase subtilisin/kexin type 5; Proprotein convertase 5; Proprotein convertase 6; Subtilisin/kexin-like protease PC5
MLRRNSAVSKMRICKLLLVALVLVFLCTLAARCIGSEAVGGDGSGSSGALGDVKVYTDTWAVQVRSDVSERDARRLAENYGFDHIRQVGYLEDIYHWDHTRVAARSRRAAADISGKLKQEPKVVWFRQQHLIWRTKRSSVLPSPPAAGIALSDPLWEKEWHLNDEVHEKLNTNLRSLYEGSLEVVDAWQDGYTGHGVTVVIVDDGVEYTHPDLVDNYERDISVDLNSADYNPLPRYTKDDRNKHGTACAGITASAQNNSVCGSGVAPNVTFGAIRVIDGPEMDILEAAALVHRVHDIDIFSSSWGPRDNGKDLDGPGPLTVEALLHGASKGRAGLGNLYVFASGNGGYAGDSCAYDGYASSRFTLTISAVTQTGKAPWYAEACSSVLASAFSSGYDREAGIVSTDLHSGCMDDFSGTSAAAPMAAGILALLLEARPTLSLRDVQHIVALTADHVTLEHSVKMAWQRNAAEFHFSPYFGFGLLNASAMIAMATKWTSVPELQGCVLPWRLAGPRFFSRKPLLLTLPASGEECIAESGLQVEYLEQVTIIVSLRATRRSSAILDLISPSGTRVRILYPRPADDKTTGIWQWPISTSFFWGERPSGQWRVEVASSSPQENGFLHSIELVLSGTTSLPESYPHLLQRANDTSPNIELVEAEENNITKPHNSDEDDHANELFILYSGEIQYRGDRYGNANALKSLDQTAGSSEQTGNTEEGTSGMSWCRFVSSAGPSSSRDCMLNSSDSTHCTERGLLAYPSITGRYSLCLSRCPHGTFAVPDRRVCQPCRLECSQCQSVDQCTACRHGYMLHGAGCVAKCPPGFYRTHMNPGVSSSPTHAVHVIGEKSEHRYASLLSAVAHHSDVLHDDADLVSTRSSPADAAAVCLPCPEHCSHCTERRGAAHCHRCHHTTYLHHADDGDDGLATCLDECPPGRAAYVSQVGWRACRKA